MMRFEFLLNILVFCMIELEGDVVFCLFFRNFLKVEMRFVRSREEMEVVEGRVIKGNSFEYFYGLI